MARMIASRCPFVLPPAFTQEPLVAALGLNKTTYTNYEQGKREIPFALVIRLAQFYNVSIDYIAGLSNTPAPLSGKNIYQNS